MKGNAQVQSLTGVTDTIHVVHYDISIDTISFGSKKIYGKTTLTVVSNLIGVNNISLSLLKLTIDSITSSGQSLMYSYNDTTLRIIPSSILNTGDTVTLTVYYHGTPKKDSSWGGFYFAGSYAFNLGVGFDAAPHNYGRVWYPCIDEFTDRSTYSFHITTDNTKKAFCNGELSSVTSNANGTKTYHWNLTQSIPSYLACMAVGPYYSLERNIAGKQVLWACEMSDTNKVLNTFQNLDDAIVAFENAYGPYPWNKIGYSLVPFNSGAMEHASNIAIGAGYVNGTLTYETLWAHELSHMWWGDKVTCETAEDMWLNEGFASYSEALFTQAVYGNEAYKNWIRSNHREVLQFAHIHDTQYLAMNNVPHEYTYSTTVYKKGADIVHTLRYYMGDTSFFNGCGHYMNNRAFANANSFQLRDDLATSSSQNLNNFFDDWIFTEGFPHFSIDSVEEYIGAFNHYYIHTRQRSKGNNHLYKTNVDITLSDGINDTTVTVLIDSAANVFHVLMWQFQPTWFSIDRWEQLSDATTDYEILIDTTGIVPMPETSTSIDVVNKGNGTTRVRIENNWVLPDGFKQSNPGIRLSDYHYWKVDGAFDTGFYAKANFDYDGSTNPTTGFIDNNLFITGFPEDSLVLLYRQGTADDWQSMPHTVINFNGSHSDWSGSITIDTLKKGEYVLGIYDATVAVNNTSILYKHPFQIIPNPANNQVTIRCNPAIQQGALLTICDLSGRLLMQQELTTTHSKININLIKGVYLVTLQQKDMPAGTQKLIVQ